MQKHTYILVSALVALSLLLSLVVPAGIAVVMAIGGSTNAVLHLLAIARAAGVS